MKQKQLSYEEIYTLTAEWEMILSSGLPIHEGLEMVENTIDSESLKQVIHLIKTSFQEQGSLSNAIESTGVFDPYMIKMIYIGEQSGHLDQVMKELTTYYKRQEEMQVQLKEAMTYPLILLGIMFLIVFMMVYKVLPIFKDVLETNQLSLSGISVSLMHVGTIFGQVSLILSGIAFVGVLILAIVYRFASHTLGWKTFLMKCPGISKVYKEVSLAQLSYVISLFIASGYPLENLLSILCEFVEHPQLAQKMKAVQMKVQEGISFTKAMDQEKVFEGKYANMIAIASKTGQEDVLYPQLTQWMQENVERTLSHWINVMEPTIIAILSFIVGILLLSIMLPLMSLMQTL